MDTDALRRDVHAFREASEKILLEIDRTIFGRFPRGCCGDVSELLAAFLERRGHGAFTYVCGLKAGDDGRPSSHAWLERDGLIVDVTRDQFGKDGEPILVTANRSWHDDEFPQQERTSGLDELPPHLCAAFARIEAEIGGGSGPRDSAPGA